jgi:hypothetical protein
LWQSGSFPRSKKYLRQTPVCISNRNRNANQKTVTKNRKLQNCKTAHSIQHTSHSTQHTANIGEVGNQVN